MFEPCVARKVPSASGAMRGPLPTRHRQHLGCVSELGRIDTALLELHRHDCVSLAVETAPEPVMDRSSSRHGWADNQTDRRIAPGSARRGDDGRRQTDAQRPAAPTPDGLFLNVNVDLPSDSGLPLPASFCISRNIARTSSEERAGPRPEGERAVRGDSRPAQPPQLLGNRAPEDRDSRVAPSATALGHAADEVRSRARPSRREGHAAASITAGEVTAPSKLPCRRGVCMGRSHPSRCTP